jgi:Kdo2-lipid IVA lauroyltransferase/acyltransferase
MSRILSPVVYYGLVVPLSYLPFGVLYFVSDILYFTIYRVVGYRKQVVRQNLRISFPEKTPAELKTIEKEFYSHFADFLVESIKSISISDREILQRCALMNPEMVNKYYDKNKSVIVLCGHYNNWEYYAVGISQQLKHKTVAAYKPLKNSFFDKVILRSRQRFGMRMVSMRDIPRVFAYELVEPTASIMVNDQSPGNPKTAHWNTFLNQETGWMTGPERLAEKYQQAVLFGVIRKVKRGYYEVTFREIAEDVTNYPKGYVLDTHAQFLEEIIREKPQYWLWSHKRWKHKPTNT